MKRKLHILLAVGLGLTASVGWLQAIGEDGGITTYAALKSAIENAAPGETITLASDIKDANTSGKEISAIAIKKPIVLDGNGHTISGAAAKNIIQITKWEENESTATLRNLTITNTKQNGLVVHRLDPKQQVVLENVKLIGNAGAGMVLNASKVKAKSLIIHSNTWGSVNLEGSEAVGDSLALSLDQNSILAGPNQIWADHAGKGGWFTTAGWTSLQKLDGGVTKTFWTNKLVSKTYRVDFATEMQDVIKLAKIPNTIDSILLNRDININDLYQAQSNVGVFQGIMNLKTKMFINGQGHKISGTFLPADPGKYYYALKLDSVSAGSTIQNLTIEGTNATALDIVTGSTTPVKLLNVTLKNNTGGGLNVNSSYVEATDLVTSGNGIASVRLAVEGNWKPEIAIAPHFTLKGNAQIAEDLKVAYNAKENPSTYNMPNAAKSIAERLQMVSIETTDKANWATSWQMAKFRAIDSQFPALVWTNSFDATSLPGKKLAKMSTAAELDSLFTFGGATVDGIAWTAAEKQILKKDITLDKSFAIIGNDSARCVVEGAVTMNIPVGASASDVIIKNVKFDYAPVAIKSGRCQPVFLLKDGKIDLSVENCLINNKTAGYGYGYGTSAYNKMQNVFQSDSTVTGTMSIKNTIVNLLANNQRAISAHGKLISITMVNSAIKGLDSGSQQHGACIHRDNTSLTLDNTTINLNNHYGIWIIEGSGQKVNIANKSLISGFGALYLMGSSGVQVTVSGGSNLTGITKNNGPSDSFGSIIFEGATNSKIEIADSYIGNEFKSDKTASMTPILISNNTDNFIASNNNEVILKGKSIVRTLKNSTNPFIVDYGLYPDPKKDNNIVKVEGTEVQFKDQNDKNCIVVNNQDGSFRNAAVSIKEAIVYEKDWAIANSGDIVIAPDTTVTQTLKSLNAASAFAEYNVPDSIIIKCKDGYLVTGEKAANAFANNTSDKAVFFLKQDGAVFSTVAAGDNRVKVTLDQVWNDASKANRSVQIAAGATLTINVEIPLDTVFMAEGAQVKATAAVTAKAVQLTYGVKKAWKAFGFPFTIGTIKNAADKAIQTVAQSADGIWTASIASNAPTFTVTAADATPAAACLIAAEKDSTIMVTSAVGSVSLASKSEPTITSGNFVLVSNPNTYAITLSQTAYVLSADGKTFDRTDNALIKPFQSYVLADANTTGTLRSLRVGESPTHNEIVPAEGYFVTAGRGVITIHTAEPVQVVVVDMLGRVYYNARVTTDGYQIAVPAGIYAVNKQKVVVK